MSRSVVDVREFGNARELAEALGLLLDVLHGDGNDDQAVYIEATDNGRPGTASLVEETLSDGSKVHNILLHL